MKLAGSLPPKVTDGDHNADKGDERLTAVKPVDSRRLLEKAIKQWQTLGIAFEFGPIFQYVLTNRGYVLRVHAGVDVGCSDCLMMK